MAFKLNWSPMARLDLKWTVESVSSKLQGFGMQPEELQRSNSC